MTREELKELLTRIAQGETDVDTAIHQMRLAPIREMDFAGKPLILRLKSTTYGYARHHCYIHVIVKYKTTYTESYLKI